MELWRDVFEAADRALEMEPAERERFLDRCLDEHPKIGVELKALIDAAAAVSTLETPAAVFAAASRERFSAGSDRFAAATE